MLTHPKPPEEVSPSPSPLPQRKSSEIGGNVMQIGPRFSVNFFVKDLTFRASQSVSRRMHSLKKPGVLFALAE